MNCDVFISYRRQDGVFPAMIMYRDLVEAGYNVFYDIEKSRNGELSKIIYENIYTCTDFIFLITQSTFSERIYEPNDWVRRELELAIELKKNIIPVFIGDALIPKTIPASIEKIRDFGGVCQIDPYVIREINKKISQEYMLSKATKTDRKAIVKSRCSIYDASYGNERDRLAIQANNSLVSDMNVINYEIKDKKQIKVLDVGCAYGYVGKTRFSGEQYDQIIGIDSNEQCIKNAMENNEDDRFDYLVANVEEDNFEQLLKAKMEEKNITGFDVIFVALVIHHLKNPVAVLRKIRKYLSDDGIIIVRGSDDGSKLAYGDDNTMEEIINLTMEVENVSDRFNGRKIYNFLCCSGFSKVKMYSFAHDTSSLDCDQKILLFNESFSYRINYVRRHYEADPENIEKKSRFDKMEELLARLEEKFYDSNFWYCEYDYIGVGRK